MTCRLRERPWSLIRLCSVGRGERFGIVSIEQEVPYIMRYLTMALLLVLAIAVVPALAGEALPAYVYTGSDPVEAAVVAGTLELAEQYRADGGVAIPSPVIFRTEEHGDSRILVYGDFRIYSYTLKDHVLENVSGGQAPGIMTLEKSGDAWTATDLELARDGGLFEPDIRRFCNGDKALEDLYFSSSQTADEVRLRFVRDYVSASRLDVDALQDYGRDPVPLWTDRTVIDELAGRTLLSSSDAGAWSTIFDVLDYGEFEGYFNDNEPGEAGDRYPNGTVYTCHFRGRFTDPVQVDEWTWKITVAVLVKEEGQEAETVEGGIRYIQVEPCGLKSGQEVLLFLPGKPLEDVPAEFMPWSFLDELAPGTEVLPYYAIWNEAEGSGFIGDPVI